MEMAINSPRDAQLCSKDFQGATGPPAFCILISGFQRRPWGRTMAENSASYPPTVVRSVEEGSDVEQLQDKRKAEFLDTNSTTKRSKPEESLDGGRKEIGPNSSKVEQDSERDGHVLGSSERHVDGRRSSDINFMIQAEAAEDRGSRHRMEDAFIVLLDAGMSSAAKLRCAHFAIYDGHGGRLAAEYALKHLHPNVLSAGLLRELLDVKAAKKAILDGFKKTDESLLQESAAGGWQDGATAVCVWILEKTVFVANIGDAKAVVARSSNLDKLLTNSDTPSQLKAIVLTREHKAIYPHERARIQKAGGSVSSNGRLQGRLEVSRAFGDRQFKKVGVIATPDVFSFELTESEQFIILGSDGLWGVFGPSDAVDFVSKLFKEGLSISAVCRRLVKEAVIERGCKDNCTAIVIALRRS